jgi:nucleoside-diphosphate-sugar epimerase
MDPMAQFHRSNVEAAVSMLKASLRAGVRKFIFLSSAGVLGQASPPGGFTDASQVDAYDPYTRSKSDAEQKLRGLMEGNLQLAVVRPPMVYGRGAPGSYRRLCRWIDRGLPLPLGNIATRRSYVGVRNLCDLLVTIAASAPAAEAPPLLVADPRPLSVAEFATQIAAVRGRRARLLPVPVSLLRFGLRSVGLQDEFRRLALPFELAPSEAERLFGWHPPYTTTEELGFAAQNSSVG